MLLFRAFGKKILFTGDLLAPLLKDSSYTDLEGVDLMVVDCNNRFPWPGTNHWSFAGHPGWSMDRSEVLKTFIRSHSPENLLLPHRDKDKGTLPAYLKSWTAGWDPVQHPFTILEFCRRIKPLKVMLVHYSGTEDLKHHDQEILDREKLHAWANSTAQAEGIGSEFLVPGSGERVEP
jgi:hypothetical protein